MNPSSRRYIFGRTAFLSHTYKCFRLLSRKAKFAYLGIVIFQSLISVLDLVGLALIMKIVLGFQSIDSHDESSLKSVLPVFGSLFSNVDSNTLLISVVVIFVFKGLFALFLHTLTVKLMTSETLKLIVKLNESIFENRTSRYRNLSNQDISFTLYNAAEIVFRDTLVPVSIIFADSILLVLVCLNLLVTAQILFFPTTIYFMIIFFLLRRIEKKSTSHSLKIQLENEILGRSLIQETAVSLRELYVSSNLNWMVDRILRDRSDGLKAGSVI